MLGFDFHDRESLKEDIDQFVALKTSAYQISPLTPCPGTALYNRLMEEERILDSYRWEDFHLWKDDVFQLNNFEKGEIKEFFDYAHDQIRDMNGPQPLQFMESALDCYQLLKDRTDEFHAFQARRAKARASGISAYLRSVKLHHQSEKVRARVELLERRFKEEIGDSSLLSKVVSYYLSRKIKKNCETPRPPVISDPPPRWSYYHTFDDRVWVRKGRKAKRAIPYRDRRSMAISLARIVRGRVGRSPFNKIAGRRILL